MGFQNFVFTPGINVELSQSLNKKGYSKSNLIRWRYGLPEKLGGWAKLSPMQMTGVCRGMHAWGDLSGNPYLIAGTSARVYVYEGGTLFDVTPLRKTSNIAVDFSTVDTTNVVTIKDTGNSASQGDWIYISTQVSVGGLVLYGYYPIATIVDADNYTILAAGNATATVSHGGAVPSFTTTNTSANVNVQIDNHGQVLGNSYNFDLTTTVGGVSIGGPYVISAIVDANNFTIVAGSAATSSATASENSGDVQILYLLPTGSTDAIYESGYGIGDYGEGDYGIGEGVGALLGPREWFFDTWGGDTIGNYSGGPMYIWEPPFDENPRMTVLGDAPDENTCSFVSMPAQIAVTCGTETGDVFDPNLIRWCDVDDLTDWVATVTNQAGSYRIPNGSRIVGAQQTPLQGLIWTDLGLWSMRYIGTPFIFGFTDLGDECGLIGARAMCTLGGITYWMGPSGFFVYNPSSGVSPIKCPVWDIVFKNLNTTQVEKITAAGNSDFSEIAWHFPSAAGSGENDTYVKVNLVETGADGQPVWDYGSLARTAWEDRSPVGPPVGADGNNYLQQHEISPDADGSAMNSFAETGYTDLSEGEDFPFIDLIVPDFVSTPGSTINLTATSRKAPRLAAKTYGPYQITDNTGYVTTRIRGRQVAFNIGSTDLGSWWRAGLNRYRVAPDGRNG